MLAMIFGTQRTNLNIPPWVGTLLLIEDIEGVCAGAQDDYAEDDDQSREDGLSKVEGCWVDLHLADFTITLCRGRSVVDENTDIADAGQIV